MSPKDISFLITENISYNNGIIKEGIQEFFATIPPNQQKLASVIIKRIASGGWGKTRPAFQVVFDHVVQSIKQLEASHGLTPQVKHAGHNSERPIDKQGAVRLAKLLFNDWNLIVSGGFEDNQIYGYPMVRDIAPLDHDNEAELQQDDAERDMARDAERSPLARAA